MPDTERHKQRIFTFPDVCRLITSAQSTALKALLTKSRKWTDNQVGTAQ